MLSCFQGPPLCRAICCMHPPAHAKCASSVPWDRHSSFALPCVGLRVLSSGRGPSDCVLLELVLATGPCKLSGSILFWWSISRVYVVRVGCAWGLRPMYVLLHFSSFVCGADPDVGKGGACQPYCERGVGGYGCTQRQAVHPDLGYQATGPLEGSRGSVRSPSWKIPFRCFCFYFCFCFCRCALVCVPARECSCMRTSRLLALFPP
jgi:hypothetical protein